MNEDFFKVVTQDGEVSSLAATPEVSCGTRKSRNKRVKRHTVGLFVVAYPYSEDIAKFIVIGDLGTVFPCLN